MSSKKNLTNKTPGLPGFVLVSVLLHILFFMAAEYWITLDRHREFRQDRVLYQVRIEKNQEKTEVLTPKKTVHSETLPKVSNPDTGKKEEKKLSAASPVTTAETPKKISSAKPVNNPAIPPVPTLLSLQEESYPKASPVVRNFQTPKSPAVSPSAPFTPAARETPVNVYHSPSPPPRILHETGIQTETSPTVLTPNPSPGKPMTVAEQPRIAFESRIPESPDISPGETPSRQAPPEIPKLTPETDSSSSVKEPAVDSRIPAESSSGKTIEKPSGHNPEEVRKFRNAVAARIERVKVYPRQAREERQEGRVIISFDIQPTGGVGEVSVLESSGFPLLDQAARDSIRAGAPYLPFPHGLDRAIRVRMTINFNLRS